MTYYTPLTADDWKRFMAATRHRRAVARQVELDEEAGAWLAAVARDDRTDPHEDPLFRPAIGTQKGDPPPWHH